jgi:hypothetical protein
LHRGLNCKIFEINIIQGDISIAFEVYVFNQTIRRV